MLLLLANNENNQKLLSLAALGDKGAAFLESYTNILNYVEPEDPQGSYLYRALIGDGKKQVPLFNPLLKEIIQTIYGWIKQGEKRK